jgi:hypothetical protein
VPQIGGDHRRQFDRHRLEPAINLARHLGVTVADLQFGGEGRLRPALASNT